MNSTTHANARTTTAEHSARSLTCAQNVRVSTKACAHSNRHSTTSASARTATTARTASVRILARTALASALTEPSARSTLRISATTFVRVRATLLANTAISVSRSSPESIATGASMDSLVRTAIYSLIDACLVLVLMVFVLWMDPLTNASALKVHMYFIISYNKKTKSRVLIRRILVDFLMFEIDFWIDMIHKA